MRPACCLLLAAAYPPHTVSCRAARRFVRRPEVHAPAAPRPSAHPLQGLTLKQHIEHTLGTGSIEDAVRLPAGEDLNEWLAVNVVSQCSLLLSVCCACWRFTDLAFVC